MVASVPCVGIGEGHGWNLCIVAGDHLTGSPAIKCVLNFAQIWALICIMIIGPRANPAYYYIIKFNSEECASTCRKAYCFCIKFNIVEIHVMYTLLANKHYLYYA